MSRARAPATTTAPWAPSAPWPARPTPCRRSPRMMPTTARWVEGTWAGHRMVDVTVCMPPHRLLYPQACLFERAHEAACTGRPSRGTTAGWARRGLPAPPTPTASPAPRCPWPARPAPSRAPWPAPSRTASPPRATTALRASREPSAPRAATALGPPQAPRCASLPVKFKLAPCCHRMPRLPVERTGWPLHLSHLVLHLPYRHPARAMAGTPHVRMRAGG
jgi:hypothetical protein